MDTVPEATPLSKGDNGEGRDSKSGRFVMDSVPKSVPLPNGSNGSGKDAKTGRFLKGWKGGPRAGRAGLRIQTRNGPRRGAGNCFGP